MSIRGTRFLSDFTSSQYRLKNVTEDGAFEVIEWPLNCPIHLHAAAIAAINFSVADATYNLRGQLITQSTKVQQFGKKYATILNMGWNKDKLFWFCWLRDFQSRKTWKLESLLKKSYYSTEPEKGLNQFSPQFNPQFSQSNGLKTTTSDLTSAQAILPFTQALKTGK